jgi:hypothetical protein
MSETTKKPRGFQTMTPEKRREIASSGGRAAHASGNAHQYTSEQARAAAAARRDRQPKP